MSDVGVIDVERVTARLAAYSAALESLLCDNLADLTAAEVVEFARVWEIQQRRAVVVTHTVMAAVGSSGAPGELGYRDATALLVDVLRVDPGEARGRVRAAAELGPQRSFTGQPLAPQFAAIAAAQREGTISSGHARVIVAALDSLSPEADLAHGSAVQELLVDYAGQFTPRKLNLAAARVLAHLDPDGARPSEAEQQRRRYLDVRSNADGSGHIEGRLTPEALATLRAVLDSLSAPKPAHDGTDAAGAGVEGSGAAGVGVESAGGDPGVEGEGGDAGVGAAAGDASVAAAARNTYGDHLPDSRTPGQRRHDALLDAAHRLLRSAELPSTGGVPTTLILTATAAEFAAQRGFATTPNGDLVPMQTARRLAGEADVFLAIVNASGGILDYGRSRRLATASQRCVVWVRDGGCTFPGCTMPVIFTELHHVHEWMDGGHTSVENMVALCRYHHRTFAGSGWRVVMRDGVPWWIPPPHVDPHQTPIQNQHWKTPILRL